jgi:hypothetical protein
MFTHDVVKSRVAEGSYDRIRFLDLLYTVLLSSIYLKIDNARKDRDRLKDLITIKT